MSEKAAAGTVIPFSTLFLPVLIVFAVLELRKRSVSLNLGDAFVAVYILLITLSFCVGQVVYDQSFFRTGAFYIQTIVPAAWYFMARIFVSSPKDLSINPAHFYIGFVRAIALTVVVSMVLYLIQTALSGGSDYRYSMISDHVGPFFNFKIKKFYSPFLVFAACIFIAVGISRLTSLKISVFCLVAGALCAAGPFFVWSRTGILTVVVGLALVLVFLARDLRYKRSFIRAAVFLCVILGALGLTSLFEAQALVRMIDTVSSFSGDQLQDGDANRLDTMAQSANVGLLQPLGDMFRLVLRADGYKTIGSENGFLDVAARGGPLAMLSLVLLGFYACMRLLAVRRIPDWNDFFTPYIAGSCAGLAAIFFVSGILLTVLLEPYCSALIWSLLGASCSLPVPMKKVSLNT